MAWLWWLRKILLKFGLVLFCFTCFSIFILGLLLETVIFFLFFCFLSPFKWLLLSLTLFCSLFSYPLSFFSLFFSLINISSVISLLFNSIQIFVLSCSSPFFYLFNDAQTSPGLWTFSLPCWKRYYWKWEWYKESDEITWKRKNSYDLTILLKVQPQKMFHDVMDTATEYWEQGHVVTTNTRYDMVPLFQSIYICCGW